MHKFRSEAYTQSKAGKDADPRSNEDVFAYNDDLTVIADGSTSKNKAVSELIEQTYGATGGRIAAEIATEGVKNTDLNGKELVGYINAKIREASRKFSPSGEPLENIMATTLAAARIERDTREIVVTQVGDTAFRATFSNDSQMWFIEERKIDVLDAVARSKAVRAALEAGESDEEAMVQGRAAIADSLGRQVVHYWNNPDSEYGMGYIAGSEVPDKFINVYRFSAEDIKTIEFMSDGYLYGSRDEFPQGSTIQVWEDYITRVHEEDPYKYERYPATKPIDDRTIIISHLEQ